MRLTNNNFKKRGKNSSNSNGVNVKRELDYVEPSDEDDDDAEDDKDPDWRATPLFKRIQVREQNKPRTLTNRSSSFSFLKV